MIKQLYDHFLKFPTICTDSRNILPNSIFFALKGDAFDGNKFAMEAIKKGAQIAVVDDPALKEEAQCFYVQDALSCLQELATYHRKQLNIPILAITGTNGKTTTKELCGAVLSKKFKTYFTQGNFNNHIGVPLSILSISPDIEFAVIEMGANHVGEIAKLCTIAQPDYGLITNVGKAHLEGFGSFENIIKTKTELYQWIEQYNGLVFYHNIHQELINKLPKTKCISYGEKKADFQITPIKNKVFASVEWDQFKIESNLLGSYNCENIMAAISIGSHFGVQRKDINSAIQEYRPKNHRSQVIETARNYIILDAYNANPSSMKEALLNFHHLKKDNKVLILGDMFELGEFAKKEHQEIVRLLHELNFEEYILVGKDFYSNSISSTARKFKTTEDLKSYLKTATLEAKSILVKGSRGMKLEESIPYL